MIDLTNRKPDKRRKTSIALPGDLQDEARKIAERYGISLSEYVKRLVEADLTERRKYPL